MLNVKTIFCATLFLFHISIIHTTEDDYYKLLGVEKNAELKQIRKAFKQLAVQLHPDKNKDDPSAQALFIKVAEAYEVLKDPEKRSDYDIYGKRTTNYQQPQYHSYRYYTEFFGIYDDDPLIITLSESDFENSIGDGIWFVNFYSPQCSHCHLLAPEWRKLSELLEGVVKIGAVNCGDDMSLCWQIPIQQFPTLIFFNEWSNKNTGVEYGGTRTSEFMQKYVLSQIERNIDIPVINNLSEIVDNHWALFLCPDEEECPLMERIKLAALLKGLTLVGFTKNNTLIKEMQARFSHEDTKLVFYEHIKGILQEVDVHEGNVGDQILNMLPDVVQLHKADFQRIRDELRTGSESPWLLCFTMESDKETRVMLKKLAGRLTNFKIGELNCALNVPLCNTLYIANYPSWGILKVGGAYEAYTGKSTLHAVERFALDAHEATNFHTLSPSEVERITSQDSPDSPWIICWVLTGCPPCKKMIPPMRKASIHFSRDVVQFGIIDCKFHSSICNLHGINSFPNAVLYNTTSKVTYTGDKNEDEIIEFIQMQRSNLVVKLTPDNFDNEVMTKDGNLEGYLVDFVSPRCGPCQRLQPEWIKLAKKLIDVKTVKIGSVDCEQYGTLCMRENIRFYPSIRMYPLNSKTFDKVQEYQNHMIDHLALQKWVLSILSPSTTALTSTNFKILLSQENEKRTWVVMFYATWCGFCHQFEPDFLLAMKKLNNIVVGGKVNCQTEGVLCHSEYINSYPTVKLYQKINGKINFDGIEMAAFALNDLVEKIKMYAGSASITPVDHDEL